MRSRPFSSFTNAGGAYVLGGVKRCPQVSGPLFSGDGFIAGAVAGPGSDGEEGAGEHGQGGVPVPGPVPADLVVVQAGLAFRLGEAVLSRPPLMPMKWNLSLAMPQILG
jgi:hypothetical protein